MNFNFLKQAWNWLKSLFEKGFDELRHLSGPSVKIVDAIKAVVENPALDFITELTGTGVDDKILHKARLIVPALSEKLNVIHGVLDINDKDSDAVEKFLEYLRSLNPDARTSFWVILAGELNVMLADGKITLAEGIAFTQLFFAERRKLKS